MVFEQQCRLHGLQLEYFFCICSVPTSKHVIAYPAHFAIIFGMFLVWL